MVRVNLVDPIHLADEHLYAENVELLMMQSFIQHYPNGYIPEDYTMGKGHISFFRNKPNFISYRQRQVDIEINNRRKNPNNIEWSILNIHLEFLPNTKNIRDNTIRIVDRLRHPKKKKNNWHYYGKPIDDIEIFIKEHYGDY